MEVHRSTISGKFNRLVTLCSDHTRELGLALLEASLEHEQDGQQDAAMVVELLIFAHCSFTLACDVENIGVILNRARLLIDAPSASSSTGEAPEPRSPCQVPEVAMKCRSFLSLRVPDLNS